jgi:hypothetical protein
VIDPTRVDAAGIVAHLVESWRARGRRASSARSAAERVRSIAASQMDEIAGAIGTEPSQSRLRPMPTPAVHRGTP